MWLEKADQLYKGPRRVGGSVRNYSPWVQVCNCLRAQRANAPSPTATGLGNTLLYAVSERSSKQRLPKMPLATLDHQLVALLQSHESLSINAGLPQVICMRKGKERNKKPQWFVNFWTLISVRKSIILVTKCSQKHIVLRDTACI